MRYQYLNPNGTLTEEACAILDAFNLNPGPKSILHKRVKRMRLELTTYIAALGGNEAYQEHYRDLCVVADFLGRRLLERVARESKHDERCIQAMLQEV